MSGWQDRGKAVLAEERALRRGGIARRTGFKLVQEKGSLEFSKSSWFSNSFNSFSCDLYSLYSFDRSTFQIYKFFLSLSHCSSLLGMQLVFLVFASEEPGSHEFLLSSSSLRSSCSLNYSGIVKESRWLCMTWAEAFSSSIFVLTVLNSAGSSSKYL